MKRKSFERLSRLRPGHSRGKPAHLLSVVAVLLIGATVAHAQDFEGDRFTLRGFGTLGATTHDADGIEFRRDTGQVHGATAGDATFETDSLAGVQIDARISSELDVVIQGVTHQRAEGDWTPEMTQGFLRWKPDESLVLRAGRVGYDIYLLAESRQVGYSYLAVRPSPEFYGQITNDSIDGADVSYTRRAGRGLVRARLFGGGGSGELAFADGTHRDAVGDVNGATFDYIYRGWTARVAYVRFSYEAGAEIPLLVGALRATGFPSAAAVADDLDKDVYISDGVQIGVAYDDGPVLAQIMYGAITSDSLAGPEFDKTIRAVRLSIRPVDAVPRACGLDRPEPRARRRPAADSATRAAERGGGRHPDGDALHAAHHVAGPALRLLVACRFQTAGRLHARQRFFADVRPAPGARRSLRHDGDHRRRGLRVLSAP